MQVMDAIYKRRAVRSYKEMPVSEGTIQKLLLAAVQAPSAINHQPWSFVVIQDKRLLKDYSDRAKALFSKLPLTGSPEDRFREMLTDPGFNIFYDAGTLVVICAKGVDTGANEDCCLAAQNFMLAAVDFGLATCPIGFARPLLNQPDVKQSLKIPADYSVVVPIVLGYPRSEIPAVDRSDPTVLSWRR